MMFYEFDKYFLFLYQYILLFFINCYKISFVKENSDILKTIFISQY